MMNVLTTSAMAAKISTIVVRKLMPSSSGPAFSSAASSPVTASSPSGSTSLACSVSSAWETPLLAVTQKVL